MVTASLYSLSSSNVDFADLLLDSLGDPSRRTSQKSCSGVFAIDGRQHVHTDFKGERFPSMYELITCQDLYCISLSLFPVAQQ